MAGQQAELDKQHQVGLQASEQDVLPEKATVLEHLQEAPVDASSVYGRQCSFPVLLCSRVEAHLRQTSSF